MTQRTTGSIFTFSWSSVVLDCPAMRFNILASNCGSCPTTTNHTTVTCTDVPTNHSTCTFAVQTVICGNISGKFSVIKQERISINDDILNHTSTEGILSRDTTNLRGTNHWAPTCMYIIIMDCMHISIYRFIVIDTRAYRVSSRGNHFGGEAQGNGRGFIYFSI